MLSSRPIEETNQSFGRVKMRSASAAEYPWLAMGRVFVRLKAYLDHVCWRGIYPMPAAGQEASRI
jgi:hypothetical protein